MKFTVDRTKWYRGQSSYGSRLRLHNGKMCCLGFACNQLGVPEERMNEITNPGALVSRKLCSLNPLISNLKDIITSVFLDNSGGNPHQDWVVQAIKDNDNPGIDDQEREKRLTALFSNAGHKIEFIN